MAGANPATTIADGPTRTTNETAGTPGVAISNTVLVQEARISGSFEAAVLRRELAATRSNRSRARHLAAFGERLATVVELVTDDPTDGRSDTVRRSDTPRGPRRLTPRAARALAARDLAQTANASAGHLPPHATANAGLERGLFARQARASRAVVRNETGPWWGDWAENATNDRRDPSDEVDRDERAEDYGWPGPEDSFIVGAEDRWWNADQHLGREGWGAPQDWYRNDPQSDVPAEQFLDGERNDTRSQRYWTGDGRRSGAVWTDERRRVDGNRSVASPTEDRWSGESDTGDGDVGRYAAAYGFDASWAATWSYGSGYGDSDSGAAADTGAWTGAGVAIEDGSDAGEADSTVPDGDAPTDDGSATDETSFGPSEGAGSDDATPDSTRYGDVAGSSPWGSTDDSSPSTADGDGVDETVGDDGARAGEDWSAEGPTTGDSPENAWSSDAWTTDDGADASGEGSEADSGSWQDAGVW